MSWHERLEGKAFLFSILTFGGVLVGGAVEIIPLYAVRTNVPTLADVKPYTPLEVLGRDLYIREGCVNCHSQMIRPFRAETERYGDYSKAGEFVYDHPFLWGSKRTGPDLQRVGGKYNNAWHYNHLVDPRATSLGSIMPAYPWLETNPLDFGRATPRMRALQRVGVPYSDSEISDAAEAAQTQADGIAKNLETLGIRAQPNTEIVALIAYLQRLGTDARPKSAENAP